ncbi:MAG: Holliday junction resolvase RuvX [Planctomycetes bacterium]|nr:Holliday junction resolvase RuvX [Planctomycetota bacterium]
MNHRAIPASGRLAGIDYGTVRIGISISDPSRIVASPYENYSRRSAEADADYFRRFADGENVVGFIVGLPVHGSGEESQKSREARRFGKWLQETTQRPVAFHDERFTSAHARQLLAGAELTRKKSKSRLDMIAAQIILASFLESSDSGVESPGPLED